MKSSQVVRISQIRRMVYFGPVLVVLLFLATAPLFLDTAVVGLITKILCFGLLAMSADIAFGYTGLWTFGHAAIFGVAAYSTAMFLRYTDLHSFWIITPIALALTAIVAAIFAAIAARSSGLYFLLITFAMGQVVYSITMQWRTVTRGNEGLWGVSYPNIGFRFNGISYYSFYYGCSPICAIILYWFTKSPFGYSLEGIRENEVRARTMGYNTGLRKVIAFVISGIFAGVAGILYVYFNGRAIPRKYRDGGFRHGDHHGNYRRNRNLVGRSYRQCGRTGTAVLHKLIYSREVADILRCDLYRRRFLRGWGHLPPLGQFVEEGGLLWQC